MFRLSHENPSEMEPTGVDPSFICHQPVYVQRLLKRNRFSGLEYLGVGILDKLPDYSQRLLFLAEALAPNLGVNKLAPWINRRAVVSTEGSLGIGKSLDELLICPSCQGELILQSLIYTCSAYERSFPYDDGILDFRIR